MGVILNFMNIYSSDSTYKSYVLFGVLFLIIALLWAFSDKFLLFIINKFPPEAKLQDINKGKWLLNITYIDKKEDGTDYTQYISGTCKIQHSLVGVKIFGDKLMDRDKKITKKDHWIAENAEIIIQNDKTMLIYLYKIPSDENKTNLVYEKVGIVVAHKQKDGEEIVYRGTFRDLPLYLDPENEQVVMREGTVVLTPTKD